MRPRILSILAALAVFTATVRGGPYAPAAGEAGSNAIAMNDPAIVAWATGIVDYTPGSNVSSIWQVTASALGPAQGVPAEGVLVLGRGGSVTLSFDRPIGNGPGYDFAIFENAIRTSAAADGWFLELGWVEVSSDGVNYVRFPNHSLTNTSIGGFGSIDPTDVDGLAGKYEAGFGTPFDLDTLAQAAFLDLSAVRYVRIIDVVGDGSARDSQGNIIYDPFPTVISAGFDLDAVAVLNEAGSPEPPQPSARIEGGILLISWETAPGLSYQLESSSDLEGWSPVGQPIAGNGSSASISLPLEGAVFYRVRVE